MSGFFISIHGQYPSFFLTTCEISLYSISRFEVAKITPCFENGKAGIARNLKNGIGFGSTEYIVIRANPDIYIQNGYSIISILHYLLKEENHI